MEISSKELLLEYLKNVDSRTLEVAYLYAKHYCNDGVDITQLQTAVSTSAALERAYLRGYRDGANMYKAMVENTANNGGTE